MAVAEVIASHGTRTATTRTNRLRPGAERGVRDRSTYDLSPRKAETSRQNGHGAKSG